MYFAALLPELLSKKQVSFFLRHPVFCLFNVYSYLGQNVCMESRMSFPFNIYDELRLNILELLFPTLQWPNPS